MGEIINYSCSCGYEKSLHIGAGRMALNPRYIQMAFTPEELSLFPEGAPKSSMMCQVIAVCDNCKELVSIATLKYSIDGNEGHVYKPCPKCGKKITPCSNAEDLSCPKCAARPLTERTAGLWD